MKKIIIMILFLFAFISMPKQVNAEELIAKQLFDDINNIRMESGLRILNWSETLDSAAKIRAEEASIYWSHTRPNGKPYYTVNKKVLAGKI